VGRLNVLAVMWRLAGTAGTAEINAFLATVRISMEERVETRIPRRFFREFVMSEGF
jgi:hypothetical protein